MADRKASVALELKAGQFKTETTIVEERVLEVDEAVKKLDKDITKIPPDAAKAGAALKLLDGDVKNVGNSVTDLGTKNAGLSILDAKIRDTQKEVKKLADEFVKTGDIDVFKKLGEAEGRLRGLRDVRKKLADALVPDPADVKTAFERLTNVAEQVGAEFGKIFSGGITGALGTPVLGPIIAGALVAAIGAAAAVVLSGAGGAILAGGALGGVGLGIIGAIMGDPKDIADAWKSQIADIKQQLVGSAAAFKGPLVEGALEFGAAIRNVHLDQILAKSAQYLPPLIAGAAGLAKYLGQGFGTLVDAAGPVVKVLAAELPKLGIAVKQAFSAIAANGEGGAQALKDILQVVERMIIGIGRLIGVAEQAYGALAKFRDLVLPRDWFFTPDAPARIENVGRALKSTGDAAQHTMVSVRGLSDAWAELRNEELAYANANLALKQGWLDLQKALAEGTRTLDTNKQAGIDNTKAILDQVAAAERSREQQVQLTGDVKAADAAYASNIERIRQMAYALGFNKQKVDELIASVVAIPPTATTEIKTPGMSEALADGISLGNALNRIDGDYYARVHVTGVPAGISVGNLTHHAMGGPVKAGVPVVVGDGGRPEVFVPNANGMIVPSIQQYANQYTNMRSANHIGSGGGMPSTLQLAATFVLPSGEVSHRQLITYALNTGRTPAQLFPAQSR